MKRVRDVLVLNRLVEIYEKNLEILKFVPGSLEAKYISSICLLSKCNNCGVGSTTLAIQPNGDLYPCPNNITDEMKLGNIFCDDFDKIWNDSSTPICAFEKEQRIEMIWLAAKKPHIFEHEVVHSLEEVNNDIVETAETVSYLERNRGAAIE